LCFKPAKLNEKCGLKAKATCASGHVCMYDKPRVQDGVCVKTPRRKGKSCNSHVPCAKSLFCKKTPKMTSGKCEPEIDAGKPCTAYGSLGSGNQCKDGGGCYIEKGETGVCAAKPTKVGDKCSTKGGLTCDYKADLYCHHETGKVGGLCAAKAAIGAKCSAVASLDVPCVKGSGCLVKEDKANGVCTKSTGNPAGSDCGTGVGCAKGLKCNRLPQKSYGTCGPAKAKA